MTTFTKKSLLLGSCAVALVLTAGVAQAASSDWTTITADKSDDQYTPTTDGKTLAISGAGSIDKATTDRKTGLKITINSATKDTLAVAAEDEIAIDGTSAGTTFHLDGIVITKGTVQNNSATSATIALGNGSNGGKLTIGANGVVQNLDATVASKALTLTGTGTFVVENAGLISLGSSTGTAIDGGTALLNFTNKGTGSVVGIIKLGSNAASTLVHTSTGTLEDIKLDTGQVLSLGDSTTPGAIVGDVSDIDGVAANRGKVNVYGTSKVASIGTDNALAEVNIAKGAALKVTNVFNAQALNIADAASHTFTGNATIGTTTLTGTGAIAFGVGGKTLTGAVVAASAGEGTITIKETATGETPSKIDGAVGTAEKPVGKIVVGEGKFTGSVLFGVRGDVYAKSIEVASNGAFGAAGGEINAPITGSGTIGTRDTDGSNFKGPIGSSAAPMAKFLADASATISNSAYVKATTIAAEKTLTIAANVTGLDLGAVDGAADNAGTISFNSNYATTAAFGSDKKLAAVNTGAGSVVFTANHNINAGTITLNNPDAIFNVNAANLTVTPIILTNGTLNINAAGLTLGTVTGAGTVNVLANFEDTAAITAKNVNVGSATARGVTFTTGGKTITADGGTFTNFAGNTLDVANSATITGTVENKGLVILRPTQVLTPTTYSAAAGSTTTFTLSSDGEASTALAPVMTGGQIASQNTSIDANATLDLATQGVVPVDGAVYRLVTSGNPPATPAFTPRTLDYSLLSYVVALEGNNINATATRKDVSALPTANADQALLAQLGGVLFSDTATDEAKKYFAPLLSLRGDGASAALQKILSASQTQNLQVAQTAMSTVVNNIGNSVGSAAAPITAASGRAVAAGGTSAQGLEFWGKLLGSKEDQESRAGYQGYKANTYGFTLGANTHLMDGVNMGLAFSMAKSEVKERVDSSSKTKTNNYFVSLYGSYSPLNTWFVDGVLTAGSGKYDQKRVDSFNSGKIYDSKFGGTTFNGTFKVGQGYKLADGMMVRPYAATSLGSTTIDAHSETGGAGSITLPKTRLNSAQLGVGAAASMVTKMADNWTMAPNLNISYMREFCTKARTLNATMVGVPVALSTPNFAADIISGGVGVKMENTEGVSVAVDYAATGKNNFIAHTGMIRVAKAF